MHKQIRLWVYTLVLLALISGCASPSPAVTPTPTTPPVITVEGAITSKNKVQFVAEDCNFNNMPPNSAIQCGSITVPENRKKTGGNTIKLHLAIIKSQATNKQADPVLLLAGMSPILQYAGGIAYGLSGILDQRDLIVMDQRGVGYSEPNLDCPELTDLFFATFDLAPYGKPMLDKSHEANVACHDRLAKSGIDLAGYTSAASAADYDDLRQALGYQQWDLYAIGSGARLAQILMQTNPSSIRSVVMDSAVPLGVSVFSGEAVHAGQALDWLFQNCAANAACQTAYPNLKQVFEDDVTQLNQDPVEVKTHDLQNGKDYTILVDGSRLIDQTLSVLGQASSNTLPFLPRMLYQVKSGRYDDQLASTLSTIGNGQPTSMGMQMAIYCGEDILSSDQSSQSNAGTDPALAQHFIKVDQMNADACQVWAPGQPSASSAQTAPAASNIPSLILQGTLSYNTPPDWGKQIAKNLSIAYYVEMNGAGSPVSFSESWSSCASTLINTFLGKPQAQLDATCASVKLTPEWITLK